MNNCITRPPMIISVLKFFSKTVSIIFRVCLDSKGQTAEKTQENETVFRSFIRRLLTISMIYNMTIDGGPNSSFVHTAFVHEKTKYDIKFNKNFEYIQNQPMELRYYIRGHIQKVIKSIADENLIFLLSIIKVNVDEADIFL